jgi:MFS family permease
VLLPLGLAVCLSLFGDLTLYAVLVTQLDVVGLSLGAVGVMLGVNRLVRIPGNPLAGVLFDRWGRRPLFLLGMLVGVLSIVGSALLRGFWPFLITRLGWGVAWTLINVGGMAMVLDVSTRANRGRLTGIYNTWMLAGLALGPLVGGLLVDALGFRPALLLCAGLCALGLAIAAAALPETAPPRKSQIANRKSQTQAAHNGLRITDYASRFTFHVSRITDYASRITHYVFRTPLFSVAALFLITQLAGEGVVLSTASLLLQQRFGPSAIVSLGSLALGVASAGGLLLALRSLLAGGVGPLAGHLSDGTAGRWPVIAGSLVLGVAGFGLLFCASSLWGIGLGIVLGAISGGAAQAVLAAQVGDLAPPGKEGVVMGAYATAGDVGSMAGPFLAFALISVVDLRWVYLLCTLAFVAGLGLLWRLRLAKPLRSETRETLKVFRNL